MITLQAVVNYRPEKPYGVGHTAHERYTRIEPGYVAEVVDGLPNGLCRVYTGCCDSRQEAVAELIAELKRLGLSGRLRVAR